MKTTAKLAIIAVLLLTLAGAAMAKKERKLHAGAYISSAKIAIVSGDQSRYPEAIAMLDSLFMHYGPNSQGLSLMGQVMVDYIETAQGPFNKREYVEKMVAYNDSLHLCCDNEDIKKKYRKDCKKFTELSDSTLIQYWRGSYNNGIELLDRVEELSDEAKNTTDSADIALAIADREAVLDTLVANMDLAVMINPNDHRAYVGIASGYEKSGILEKAIEWLEKGVERAEDKASLYLSIAYNYINLNRYCDAIPAFKNYIEIENTDTPNLYNLTVCYNNCGFYDSAMVVTKQILEVDPANADALLQVGRYWNQKGREAADSATSYQTVDDETNAHIWRDKRKEAFDSSLVYFKQASDAKPDNPTYLEEYALISHVNGYLEQAAEAFGKVTVLSPNDADAWMSLGDCHFNLRAWNDAIAAYEQVITLQSTNKEIIERLHDLYQEVGNSAKQAEMTKKLESL